MSVYDRRSLSQRVTSASFSSHTHYLPYLEIHVSVACICWQWLFSCVYTQYKVFLFGQRSLQSTLHPLELPWLLSVVLSVMVTSSVVFLCHGNTLNSIGMYTWKYIKHSSNWLHAYTHQLVRSLQTSGDLEVSYLIYHRHLNPGIRHLWTTHWENRGIIFSKIFLVFAMDS